MNKKNKAFTLIELLVAITLVTIIILWANNISFKNISDKQKLEIFNNKIISEIERVRNNSLIWKWIWANLLVPPEWKIEFSKSWSWKIITSYSWATRVINNSISNDWFEIRKISCMPVNWIEYILNNTQTWTIIFKWWKYKLWWACTENNHSSIIIKTFNKWFDYDIEFDTISWIIKR